jgi:hypothetical protein
MSGHAECPCPNCPSPPDCDGATENQRLRDALELALNFHILARTPDDETLAQLHAVLPGPPSEDT